MRRHLQIRHHIITRCTLRRLLFLMRLIHLLHIPLLSFGIQKAQRFTTTCYENVNR